MKKLLYLIILIPNLSFAGFFVCHNGEGDIVNSSSSTAICVAYSIPPTTVSDYDRIKNIINTVPRRYLKWTTEPTEMTQAEKDQVDADLLAQQDLNLRTSAKGQFDGNGSDGLALRCLAKIIMDEINILRANPIDVLPDRTLVQLKTAIQNCIDNGEADE